MSIDKTFDEMAYIACSKCDLECMLEPESNPDEAFLEFLVRYDSKMKITDCKHEGSNEKSLQSTPRLTKNDHASLSEPAKTERDFQQDAGSPHPQDGMATHDGDNKYDNDDDDTIRSETEIANMIGDENPDPLVRRVLYSKKAYLADYKIIKEPNPEYVSIPRGLDERLVSVLNDMGISKLYRFQGDAIKSILAGDNTVIEAPTASGKTEAFVLPVIQRVARLHASEQKSKLHAIFTYPTKALARDQMPKIQRFAEAMGLVARRVDGDTNSEERAKIASKPPHILVTNFDMLHHQMWRRTQIGRLLRTVRILIVDEIHAYTGIFGSNVHHIIKRLARIAGMTIGPIGNRMQFIGASATISDGRRFSGQLFGVNDMVHVCGTGPSRQIEFAMLFPSRQSHRSLVVDLTQMFASAGHRTMAFSNSHRSAELVAMYCHRRGVKIKVHRAGLMPEQRIATETAFKSKRLQAISCTPTLELGIDIGDTDCIVSAPIPINRLTQRIGRAARRQGSRGYAFLALGDDPISQYYKNHPSDYFEDAESMYIDPHNPYVEECQTVAMAHDRHIKRDEMPQYNDAIERLVSRGDLRMPGGFVQPFKGTQGQSTARVLDNYNIRGMGESVDITYNGTKVGDRVCPIALEELHQGAVYLLAGRPYIVSEFEYPDRQYAVIKQLPDNYPYHTKALTVEQPSIENTIETRKVKGIETAFCRLRIRKIVTGYVNKRWQGIESYGMAAAAAKDGSENAVLLDRPLTYTYVTKGIAFCAPYPNDEVKKTENKTVKENKVQSKKWQHQKKHPRQPHYNDDDDNDDNNFKTMLDVAASQDSHDEAYITTSGYHAAEHVVIEGSNMITGGASRDLGGISMGESGMIFIHDGVIGGSGASRALYDRLEKAFERGSSIIGECKCTSESGCPRCIMSYRCGNNNQYLHKAAALEIFERINGGAETRLLDSFDRYTPIV